MPRWHHAGSIDAQYVANRDGIDDEDKAAIRSRVEKHNPLTKPHRDSLIMVNGELHVKVPGLYCPVDVHGNAIPRTMKFVPGSVAFGLPGYGFWVVPPGGHVDLDVSVPEKAVRDAAPHLVHEDEFAAMQPAKSAVADESARKRKSDASAS